MLREVWRAGITTCVIPAKAGIQPRAGTRGIDAVSQRGEESLGRADARPLDSGLRRNDENADETGTTFRNSARVKPPLRPGGPGTNLPRSG
jgi:hypothetical protein